MMNHNNNNNNGPSKNGATTGGTSRGVSSSKRTTALSPTGFRCNRCAKPLATKSVFVCACDCVFCEDCTYDHFNSSSNCPSCNRVLKPADFMQFDIADPSSTIANNSSVAEQMLKNHTFQSMFTKTSTNAQFVTQQDVCHRLLKTLDDNKRAVRFTMKQFMVQGKQTTLQMGNMGRALNQVKKQYTQLQQSTMAQNAEWQQRVQALEATVEEKDAQLRKFREMYAREGRARIPPSAHSTGSHSSRGSRGSSGGGGDMHGHRQHHQQKQAHPITTPPLQAFILQKQVREREKERGKRNAALGLQQQRHNNGINGPDVDSVITPIQPLQPSRHLVRPSMDSILPPPGTPRVHAAGAAIVPGTPRNAAYSQQMFSASTSSSQRKRSHGSAMPEGYLQQQQPRRHPFGQQQQPPPPSVSKANPYQFSTALRH